MVKTPSVFLRLAALAGIVVSPMALAHPKLVSTSPSDHATVATPARVNLSFSETLMPVSGAQLVLTQMPGMTMPPANVDADAHLSDDAKSLVIVPKHPLSAGTYRVDWHVVSTDTHAAKGSFDFTVK